MAKSSKDGKRRLTVLQPADSGVPQTPAWQWGLIGGVAILLAWLPLAVIALAANRALTEAIIPAHDLAATVAAWKALTPLQRVGYGTLQAGIQLVAFACACLLGGLLVGRFGGRAGRRAGVAAGVMAAALGSLVSVWAVMPWGGVTAWFITVAALTLTAVAAARLGSAWGCRMRDAAA